MNICKVKWRPSGGRGEYEVVPSDALIDCRIYVVLPDLDCVIDSETYGAKVQGKPRLRKVEKNNRKKLHLTPLVLAAARLPDPAREDKAGDVQWPLENKKFLVSETTFEIVRVENKIAFVRPISASILHSSIKIDLVSRFANIAEDIRKMPEIIAKDPDLGMAIERHAQTVRSGQNTMDIRFFADDIIAMQREKFGDSNTASISLVQSLEPSPFEDDITGKEGRILTRLHSFRERSRKIVVEAKRIFEEKHGFLFCECCGFYPEKFYGERGRGRIQAHHKTPLEMLMPDTETSPTDLAMVCPNCHDVIHAKRPWITVDNLREILASTGNCIC